MTAATTAGRGNITWWCALLATCLMLLAPLTIADVPPVLDYPNHLARLFVLAHGPTDPILARFYEPRWGIIPNLALDLTVPPLLRIFPVHDVGRTVLGLILLLPVLGAVAYRAALTGRLSYWPLGSALFAYNAALLRGFLNFTASIGLALLVAAAWVAWREKRPLLAILAAATGAVMLFFCHLTGLLFFAILIGGHELASLREIWSRPDQILRRILAGLAVFAAPVILYAVSDLNGMQGDPEFRSVWDKANEALTPVMNYYWPLDLATAAFCVAVPVVCLAARWCTVQFQAAAAIVVLLVLFISLPAALKGTYDLDTRFIIMAAFAIPAALTPVAPPKAVIRTVGTVCLLLFATRMAVLTNVWRDWTGDLAAFRSVITPIKPGDVVMTVRSPRGLPNNWASITTARHLSDGMAIDAHLPALLVIEHRAFWPFLFDNLSQQPIKTREPYRTAATLVDNSADPIAVLAGRPREMRPFTHVLVLGPAPTEIDKQGLQLICANDQAALFSILRDALSPEAQRSPLPGR